jgi:hypothetical protein
MCELCVPDFAELDAERPLHVVLPVSVHAPAQREAQAQAEKKSERRNVSAPAVLN